MMNSILPGDQQQGVNKQEFVRIQQPSTTQPTYDPTMNAQQVAGSTNLSNQPNQLNQLNQQSMDQPVQLRAYSVSTTSQQMTNPSGTQSRAYIPSTESLSMLNQASGNMSNQQSFQQPIQQQQPSVMPMNSQQMGNNQMSANQLNQQSIEQPMQQQNFIPQNNSQQSFDQQQLQQPIVVTLVPVQQQNQQPNLQQNQQPNLQQNQQPSLQQNQQPSNFANQSSLNQGFLNQAQPSNNVYQQSVLDPSNETTSVQNIPQCPQLFHEPRSSIMAPVNYSYEDAWQDASTLRSAMKGLGTNEGKLIAVSSSRSQSQRLTIKQAYLEHEKKRFSW
jgi:hypothetical protein